MSEQLLNLAHGISATILEGFDRHFSIYQQITSGAQKRFEDCDWRAAQRAARERIVLYDHRVDKTMALIREVYGIRDIDTELWKQIKLCYVRRLSYHRQPELAETFYNSVFCRQFALQYYTNEYIFLRNAISTDYIEPSDGEEMPFRPITSNRLMMKKAVTAVTTRKLRGCEHRCTNLLKTRVLIFRLKTLIVILALLCAGLFVYSEVRPTERPV